MNPDLGWVFITLSPSASERSNTVSWTATSVSCESGLRNHHHLPFGHTMILYSKKTPLSISLSKNQIPPGILGRGRFASFFYHGRPNRRFFQKAQTYQRRVYRFYIGHRIVYHGYLGDNLGDDQHREAAIPRGPRDKLPDRSTSCTWTGVKILVDLRACFRNGRTSTATGSPAPFRRNRSTPSF